MVSIRAKSLPRFTLGLVAVSAAALFAPKAAMAQSQADSASKPATTKDSSAIKPAAVGKVNSIKPNADGKTATAEITIMMNGTPQKINMPVVLPQLVKSATDSTKKSDSTATPGSR